MNNEVGTTLLVKYAGLVGTTGIETTTTSLFGIDKNGDGFPIFIEEIMEGICNWAGKDVDKWKKIADKTFEGHSLPEWGDKFRLWCSMDVLNLFMIWCDCYEK